MRKRGGKTMIKSSSAALILALVLNPPSTLSSLCSSLFYVSFKAVPLDTARALPRYKGTSAAEAGLMRLRGGTDDALAAVAELTVNGSEPFHGTGAIQHEGFLARSLVKNVLASGRAAAGQTVVVCGWARTIRIQGSGSFAFLELNDGSTFKNIQIVVDRGIDGWVDIEANPHTHTAWRAEGVVVQSPGKGQEIEVKATAIRMLGCSPPDSYPLAKGRMPLDFLRGHPHLRARTNTLGAVARVRSALAFAVHSFFQEQHFHYVHTPIITTSDCEGAGELFSVTTLLSSLSKLSGTPSASPTHACAQGTGGSTAPDGAAACVPSQQQLQVDYAGDFFRKAAFLTVSGQLHAEASALALGKV